MQITHALKLFFVRYRKAEIHSRSAVLAYHTLLGIVPVLGLVFWYLKYIGVSKSWFNLTRLFLLTQLSVSSDSRLIRVFDRLTQPVGGHSWGWVGILLLLYTAWNLMNLLGRSLDSILETHPDRHLIEKRGWLKLAVRRFVVLLVFPIGLATSLVITQWIKSDSWLRHLLGIQTVGPFLALPLAWAVDVVALFLIYYFIPRTHITFRQALKASCIAGPAWEITRNLFGVYSRYMVGMHKLYGIFVAAPLFILWVHLGWMIILSGALLVRFHEKSYRPRAKMLQ